MAHAFTCRSPTCGTGNHRTELGKIRRGSLIIPSAREAEWDGDRWWVRCPVCGQRRAWLRELAREEPKEAA